MSLSGTSTVNIGTCNGIEYDDMILYDMVLTFESVDELLRCYHSNKSYWAVLSWGTVYYAVQGGSKFWVCGWNPMVLPFKWKLLSSTFLWCCLLCCLTILYVNEIQWCDHSNETSSLIFSHGAVFFGIFQNEILTYCDDTKQWNVENESQARTLIERYNLKEIVLVLVKRDLILSCFGTTVNGPLTAPMSDRRISTVKM